MKKLLFRWLVAGMTGLVGLTLTAQEPPVKGPITGKVIETMSSGGYTYLRVRQGKQKIWVATGERPLKKGVSVRVPRYWAMKDFKSKSLNRTFDWIMFASRVQVEGEPAPASPGATLPPRHPAVPGMEPTLPPGHPPMGRMANPHSAAAAAAPGVRPGSIQKLPGGRTVAECFAQKDALAGRTVKIRGVVVKYMPDIMGANWLHLRDGTGKRGTDDLVVTTRTKLHVGDVVVVEGRLAYDQSIGAGYHFAALMKNAKVKVERSAAKPSATP
jgi:hypothetical protein